MDFMKGGKGMMWFDGGDKKSDVGREFSSAGGWTAYDEDASESYRRGFQHGINKVHEYLKKVHNAEGEEHEEGP